MAPLGDASDSLALLLQALQAQYGRVVQDVEAQANRALDFKEERMLALHDDAQAALARLREDRATRERAHAHQLERARSAAGVALRSLHAELETLRGLHADEMRAASEAAAAEHTRLREWCAAQIAAVESNRDALLAEVSQRRETTLAASDAQLEHLAAEHREQQTAIRRLLSEEAERCASARGEVLTLQVAAGNERIGLQTEVTRARHDAATARADRASSLQAASEAAVEREDALRHRLRVAEAKLHDASAACAATIALSARRAEEQTELAAELREQVGSLTSRLRTTQANAAKAHERASVQKAECVELREALRISEVRYEEHRLRAARRLQQGARGHGRHKKGQPRETVYSEYSSRAAATPSSRLPSRAAGRAADLLTPRRTPQQRPQGSAAFSHYVDESLGGSPVPVWARTAWH